jgi:hypothetical protein
MGMELNKRILGYVKEGASSLRVSDNDNEKSAWTQNPRHWEEVGEVLVSIACMLPLVFFVIAQRTGFWDLGTDSIGVISKAYLLLYVSSFVVVGMSRSELVSKLGFRALLVNAGISALFLATAIFQSAS